MSSKRSSRSVRAGGPTGTSRAYDPETDPPRIRRKAPSYLPPWRGAKGEYECAKCGAKRKIAPEQAENPMPCARCGSRKRPRFVLAPGERPPGRRRPAPPSAEDRLTQREAKARAALKALERMRAAAMRRADHGLPEKPPTAADLLPDVTDKRSALDVVDVYVARCNYKALEAQAQRVLGFPRHGFSMSRRVGGVLILRGETQVVIVQATQARFLLARGVEEGNFLISGLHWRKVLDAVRTPSKRADDTPAIRPRPDDDRVLMRELPVEVTPSVHQRAVDASTRIREHRRLAFGTTVVVRWPPSRVLRIEPVQRLEDGLGLEFSYRRSKKAKTVAGVLRPASPNRILPVLASPAVPGQELAEAWLAALIVVADLTASSGPTDSEISPSFAPTPDTAQALSSYVVGHRRRLDRSSSASQTQRDLAAGVGIRLQPRGETWVRPHARGSAPSGPLEFQWSGKVPSLHTVRGS